MREPVKRLKLYETMKADIASGVYSPGAFLPNEFELADKYGYSRGTVRSTLAMLEDDKLVELLKGKRRRLCPAKVEKAKVPLTFLLPCADFISETFPHVAAQISRRILKGVSQIAFDHNYRLETVAVSPTNNAHEIDWRKLDFVNADSMLVVIGYWYRDLFPLLSKSGCRVSFIENQAYDFNVYADYLKKWYVLTIDRISTTESAVKLLAERGCRRIALTYDDITEKNHPVLHGYESGLAKCGLSYAAWLDTFTANNETIAGIIAGFYEKNKFDALLLDPHLVFRLRTRYSLNSCLGLPENVKIMATDEISFNQQAFPSLSSTEFPYEEIGRVAAQRLLEDNFRGGQQIFSARIIERESTMHENERLSLLTTV